MERVFVHKISKHVGKKVTLKGWVYNSRRSGKIGFLTFRDGFGLLQCIVVKNDIGEEKFDLFKTLTQESSIIITGEVVKNDRAPGGYEVLIEDIDLYHLSNDYPISHKEHGTDFLMSNRHLW